MNKQQENRLGWFKNSVYHRHDKECNQKYGEIPYSQHLKHVEHMGSLFFNLIPDKDDEYIVKLALISHDTIEDARLTYKSLTRLLSSYFDNYTTTEVADIVYCVTDEKGKNREERKSDKYYQELAENKLAIFVKLSDIAANTLYSKLTDTWIYERYKKEFTEFKEKCFVKEYETFFDYVENL